MLASSGAVASTISSATAYSFRPPAASFRKMFTNHSWFEAEVGEHSSTKYRSGRQ